MLIVGGGSGKILEQLSQNQQVTYVEISKRMLRLAQHRKCEAQVSFVCADYLNWESQQKFDAVLFPFFLDLFEETSIRLVLKKVWAQLSPAGTLHVLDFQKKDWFHLLILKVMYLFFRIFIDLEAKKLPHIDQAVQKLGFLPIGSRSFYRKLISYRIYKKNADST